MKDSHLISYDQIVKEKTSEGQDLLFNVSPCWMQGRSVFGGLQTALGLHALRQIIPDLPLRSLQVAFRDPQPVGPLRVKAEILRAGKNVVFAEARIIDGSMTRTSMIAVFGAARESAISVSPRQNQEEASGTRMPYIKGASPEFTRHFAATWMKGGLPFTGTKISENLVDVSLKEEGDFNPEHLMLIADFMPPIGYSYLSKPAFGSSATWHVDILTDNFQDLGFDHWRIDAKLNAAKDGYLAQTLTIWDPKGQAALLSQQSMLVFG